MAKVVRSLTGKVEKDAANKSVTVLVERRVKHPLLGKIVKKFKKYRAHDENNQYKAGDQVVIVECKPISKTKAWTVESLASKAA
jgi:small subunit ribosomal protein S17